MKIRANDLKRTSNLNLRKFFSNWTQLKFLIKNILTVLFYSIFLDSLSLANISKIARAMDEINTTLAYNRNISFVRRDFNLVHRYKDKIKAKS